MRINNQNTNTESGSISIKSITYMYYMASILIIFGVGIGGMVQHIVFDVSYLIGAILYLICYIIKPKDKKNIRLKRLDNMNVFAGILFTISSILKMGWFPYLSQQNMWILFFTLAVVFVMYAFVIVFVIKEKKDAKKK